MSDNKRRDRSKGYKRWTTECTTKLLELVKKRIDNFEKPTSQLFYKSIIEEDNSFLTYEWASMRHKIRNLRTKYRQAIDWSIEAGFDLTDANHKEKVRVHILKICPEFDILDELFGSMSVVDSSVVFDSGESQNLIDPLITSEDEEDEHKFHVMLEEPNFSHVVDEPSVPLLAMKDNSAAGIMSESENSDLDGFTHFRKQLRTMPRLKLNSKRFKSNYSVDSMTHCEEPWSQFQKVKLAGELRIQKEKLDLDRNTRKDELDLKREKLKIDQDRLSMEKERMNEEFKLRHYEIEKKFELEKLRMDREMELKKFEIEFKHKNSN